MIRAGMFLRLVLCAGVALALAQCGLLRRKTPPRDNRLVEDMRHGRRPMGQITWLNPGGTFVHVRSPLASAAGAEATLVVKSRDGTTTGKLKVSPEHKKNVLAADIVEGSPKAGDVVFFQTAEKAVSTAPPPEDFAAAEQAGSGTSASAAGLTDGLTPSPAVPASVFSSDPAPAGGMSAEALPPLGEPSGPREIVPDFPGLSELPEPGQENGGQ